MAQIIGTAIGAIIVGLMVIQKLRKEWTTTGAETNVVQLLREQVELLDNHNKTLSQHLYDMQIQILTLRQENQELTLQVSHLENQIAEIKNDHQKADNHVRNT
jgi:regulator of replication initiation timing